MLTLAFSRRDFWQSLLLLAAGLANTLAFAPYDITALPLLTLAILSFVLWQCPRPAKAAWFGFVYGLGWFGSPGEC